MFFFFYLLVLQKIAPHKTDIFFIPTPLFRTALPPPRMHTDALKRANIGIISLFTKAISLIYKLLHEIALFPRVPTASATETPAE